MPIFVETYWATVAPADCDHLGHMNVQHYFAAVSDGMFAIMVRLGLCPEEIRLRQISFAVVRLFAFAIVNTTAPPRDPNDDDDEDEEEDEEDEDRSKEPPVVREPDED